MRFFDTAGPVRPDDHYAIAPLARVDVDELLGPIRAKQYFVLHAPRQTGKTSALITLCDLPNSGAAGSFRCVDVNVEVGQVARDDVAEGMRAVLSSLAFDGPGVADGQGEASDERHHRIPLRPSPPPLRGATPRPAVTMHPATADRMDGTPMEYGPGIPACDPPASRAGIEAFPARAGAPGFSCLAVSGRSIAPRAVASRRPCTDTGTFPGPAGFVSLPLSTSDGDGIRLPGRAPHGGSHG